ncbi:diguanylate cyclase domain-containing protein, partial [Devosia sp.]|uniref:diguanylate cyclase domain-containing protein n=1 Tax=Devosia sp. TaxID=1871048 RepID=UPI002AFF69F8
MAGMEILRRFFAVPAEPELVLAQARALSGQIPLMYGILLINSLALAATHQDAPALLRLYIPAALALICAIRIFTWWRSRDRQIDFARARSLLGSTVAIAVLLGAGFAAWALSLYPYGNAFQQSHVAFYMGITSICCVFSLTHLRAAAMIVAVGVLVPFTLFFVSTGNPVFAALAINLLLVMAGLMWILFGNFRNFAEVVAARTEMERKQAETQRLSDENHRLANIDNLTGLPNRRSFVHFLQAALEKAEAEDRRIAVARLDLDNFKSVNDIFGQITGDSVLVEV